jgi:hypothetical protein
VRLLPVERVEVGKQVTPDPMHADQLGDRHLLGEHRLFAIDRVEIGPPANRLVRHAEVSEDPVVEAVLAE